MMELLAASAISIRRIGENATQDVGEQVKIDEVPAAGGFDFVVGQQTDEPAK